MGQLEELEGRIAAAFARIAAGVEALEASRAAQAAAEGDAAAGQDPALHEALDNERATNSQLMARLREVSDQRSATETALRAEVGTLTRALDAQGLDVQRLSATVAQLREDLRRLREGAEQGVVDPSLINRAMLAELEALRSTRVAEANEMTDILSALGGVLETEEGRAHA